MIRINLRPKVFVELAPCDVVIAHASDKYVDIYTKDSVYIHDESISTLVKKYPNDFVEVKRGLLVNVRNIASIHGTTLTGKQITLKEHKDHYPNDITISRRSVGSVMRKLVQLGRLPSNYNRRSCFVELS